MNEDTVCLLKACNVGCKSAVNSLQQVTQFAKDTALKEKLTACTKAHSDLGDACHELLEKGHKKKKTRI